MTSAYNRVSGLWTDSFEAETGETDEEQGMDDERTELDKTIDKIGMGEYIGPFDGSFPSLSKDRILPVDPVILVWTR